MSCAAAKAVAISLLDLRCAQGADGDTPPSWEVEGDHRHAGLAPCVGGPLCGLCDVESSEHLSLHHYWNVRSVLFEILLGGGTGLLFVDDILASFAC